jgi:hypothetical protein
MGTWAAGPFDNDMAADWCGDLDEAAAPEREGLVREALEAAVDEDEYLDSSVACEAVAAAAVVASQRPGGAKLVQSSYAPDFLEQGESLPLPADLIGLARRALERVLGADSEWRELWDEGDPAEALAEIAALQALLQEVSPPA